MNKRLKLLTTTLAIAGLLAVTFGASLALAHDPAESNGDWWDGMEEYCHGDGGMMGDGGHGMGGYFGHDALYDEVVSDLLGLSAEEIQAQRLEGKSLVEIAAAVGVSEDALVTAILAARTATIQELVAAGTITQEQADFMIQNMEQQITLAVNRTGTGHGYDSGSMMGGNMMGGMMGGWR